MVIPFSGTCVPAEIQILSQSHKGAKAGVHSANNADCGRREMNFAFYAFCCG